MTLGKKVFCEIHYTAQKTMWTYQEGRIMENEKIKSPREESNIKASLLFKNKEVGADLRNISTGGAFLTVAEEDNDKITSTDTGQVITFRLAKGNSYIDHRGTIGRYTESDENKKYLAIFFNHRTMHQSI
jgi:hypothetical protein